MAEFRNDINVYIYTQRQRGWVTAIGKPLGFPMVARSSRLLSGAKRQVTSGGSATLPLSRMRSVRDNYLFNEHYI